MRNKRWSVYTVKNRAKDSTEKALSPSTAGKEGRKVEKVGQSMGRGLKRPLRQSEHDMQAAVIAWCRAHEGRRPELRLLYAIPNGGHRHISVAKKLKAEGVRAGVPDLHLPVKRSRWYTVGIISEKIVEADGLWIEMKAKGGKVSPVQAEWHRLLVKYGHRVVVCWTADDAIKAITDYLEG